MKTTGLSLQHGWTCTCLCLDLPLTGTFVKAYAVLISFLSSTVLADSLSDRYALASTRVQRPIEQFE